MFCYAQDSSYAGGSLGAAHAETIVRVLELARRARAPVVGFVSSGGARMQEGIDGLGGYGRVFRAMVALSGQVPQISIISGLSAGGGAYAPALTDWIVMTQDSSMFLTGPSVVREALGEGSMRRRSAARACTCATASRTSSPGPISRRRCSHVTCSATFQATVTCRCRAPLPARPTDATRGRACPSSRAASTTSAA